MTKTCVICGDNYKTVYREWYDSLVPVTCSGECYATWINNNIRHHEGLIGEPYPRHLVNYDKRSSYEVRYDLWLRDNDVSFLYEPYSFHLGNKLYVPDFLLNIGTYVEVKGLWNSGDKTKVKDFLKTGRHLHIVDEVFLRSLNHARGGKRTKRTF